MTPFHWLALALTVLQALDGWTTYKIIKAGGIELNPIVRKLIETFELVPGLVIAKGIAIGLAWVLAAYHASVVLGLLSGLYLWIVVHNYRVLKRMT